MAIIITNLQRAKALATNPDMRVYAIVRSMTYQMRNVQQLDALSPSKQLFWHYRDLDKAGLWNKDAFRDDYLPTFLNEIKRSKAAQAALKNLWRRSRDGGNIVLACWCKDETTCHRSIIAGLLAGTGADVLTDTGDKYAEYYGMYKALPKA